MWGLFCKGGGIAAAFGATFPNLVTEKIVFVASAGLMEVCDLEIWGVGMP